MYLYYDRHGTLKEQITFNPARVGNSNVNKIFVYWEGVEEFPDWAQELALQTRYLLQNNTQYPSATTFGFSAQPETAELPFDKNQDLKYFKYYKEYKFLTIDIPDEVLSYNGAVKSYIWVLNADKKRILGLGVFAFMVDGDINEVIPDENISLAQWNMISAQLGLLSGSVIDVTCDIENNTLKVYYANGLTAIRNLPPNGAQTTISSDFLREMIFSADTWVQDGENGYYIYFRAETVGYTDNRFFVQLERDGGYNSDYYNKTGSFVLSDNIFKGSDGSVLLYSNEPYSGRLLVVGGKLLSGDSLVTGLTYNSVNSQLSYKTADGITHTIYLGIDQKFDKSNVSQTTGDSTDKVMSQKAVTDNLGDKIAKSNNRVYIGSLIEDKWQQSNGNEYSGNSTAFYLSASVEPNTKYVASGMIVNELFPLIVMFDENNNVIGTKETVGNYTIKNDYEFVTPENCKKVSINGRVFGANGIYPSLYYIKTIDKNGNDIFNSLNNKQDKTIIWEKANYEYEVNKYVRSVNYKATISDVSGIGYGYAKLEYDKNKKYRFYGQCTASYIPVLFCCDENDNVVKSYDGNTIIVKAKEYSDIPEITKYIYVNGRELKPRIEVANGRDVTSFETNKIGVFFGDSITQGNNVYITEAVTPFEDYPSVVGRLLNCTVYNAGIGGSTFSSGRSIDLKNVCDCVVSGDFSSVISGITDYGLNKSAILQYNAISELDFNNVDFVSIALGTNDWNFGATKEAVKTAMEYCIDKLLTAYPHLKIYVFTPIYRFNIGNSGQDSDTYENTTSGLKLHDICDAIIETAQKFNLPCKDMYYNCNINKYNKTLYMGDDTHPNAQGYALMGDKIGKFINGN